MSTLIIAEAGVNHNGDIDMAFALIDAAADAKADYVKFQTFKAENIVSKRAKQAEYQLRNINDNSSDYQFDMLKKLELSNSDHERLIDYAKSRNIKFFSTAFDPIGLDYLNSLGFDVFKVPSGEITNYPYLRRIASFGKRVILSTGMATMDEIGNALDVLFENGLAKDRITVLHCNTEYPTPMNDVNLKAMQTIGRTFGTNIGYSDHTLGIEVPIAAVALGATVIEKHFTLDRSLPGPDHNASLTPNELIDMVSGIRNVELALSGSGLKVPSKSETKNIIVARKSIHLITDVSKGERLEERFLSALRPGDGISPMHWREIVGSVASKDLVAGNRLEWTDFEK